MKKTEKIEIRLSHEDKERLNTIAEREGRTISQIVRGLIDRYMDLNSASDIRQTPLKVKLIWGLLGAVFATPLIWGIMQFYSPQKMPTSSHQFAATIWFEEGGVHTGGIGVPLIDGFSDSFEMHSEATKVKIELKLEETDFQQYKLRVDFCRIEERSCQALTGTSLSFDSDSAAETTIHDEYGNSFYVSIN